MPLTGGLVAQQFFYYEGLAMNLDFKPTEKYYDFWKSVALFLAGILVTLTAFWATNFREMVTRDDVEKMLEAHTRMSQAQNDLMQMKLDTVSAQIKVLQEQTTRLNENIRQK